VGLYFVTLLALRKFVAWRGKPLDAELRGVVLGASRQGQGPRAWGVRLSASSLAR
jgi:hypothetical protein